LIGGVATVVCAAGTPLIVSAFGASEAVGEQARTYLFISALAIPGMLLVLATTGVLRGLQDLRTPLVVMIAANVANVVLNIVLVYGAGLGIAGAALGTVLAQWSAAIYLTAVVVRAARRHRAAIRPNRRGILEAANAGVALVIRTLTLRASLLLATFVAAALGDVQLAAHQIAVTLVSTLAFALDAIAIAGQALTGKHLGAGDTTGTRRTTRRMIGWGIGSGVVAAGGLLGLHTVLPSWFTGDPAVAETLIPALVVVAVIQPLSGVVFVLDGVLIGAGDGTYLAKAGVLVLGAYAPLAAAVWVTQAGLVW